MASKRRIKRSDRKRTCEGKVRHHTLEDAEKARRITAHKYKQSWLITYKCKWCSQYHVGHAPSHVRKAMLARG